MASKNKDFFFIGGDKLIFVKKQMNVMSLSMVRTTNVYARLAGYDILIMLSDSVCNKHYCNIIHIEIELIKTKFRSTDIFIHTFVIVFIKI